MKDYILLKMDSMKKNDKILFYNFNQQIILFNLT